jgi:hypothetical protein
MSQHLRRLHCPARQWTHPQLMKISAQCELFRDADTGAYRAQRKWLTSDKQESFCKWLWLHNGTTPVPSGTDLPSKDSPCPGQTSNQAPPKYKSRTLPLCQPVSGTKHFMISPTPSLDLISRPYLLFRLLQKSSEVHYMNLKIKRNFCPLGIQFLLMMNNMVTTILSMR